MSFRSMAIGAVIGTKRRSLFFVPVSPPRIQMPSSSTSDHLTFFGSFNRHPLNARNSIRSPHCLEHHAPSLRTDFAISVNCWPVGNSRCFPFGLGMGGPHVRSAFRRFRHLGRPILLLTLVLLIFVIGASREQNKRHDDCCNEKRFGG
jgi:hypothetical protein